MSIKTEYRLKCDHCGNLSPVVGNTVADTTVLPTGWQVLRFGIDHYPSDLLHFCTIAHRDEWQAGRDNLRPEPRRVYTSLADIEL